MIAIKIIYTWSCKKSVLATPVTIKDSISHERTWPTIIADTDSTSQYPSQNAQVHHHTNYTHLPLVSQYAIVTRRLSTHTHITKQSISTDSLSLPNTLLYIVYLVFDLMTRFLTREFGSLCLMFADRLTITCPRQ